jgi:phenylacetic acid degradation operon negative regulatory protein
MVVKLLIVTLPSTLAADLGPANLAPSARPSIGTQPQRLLTTLLGEYWYRHGEHIPSAALVRLLEDFGVTAVGARAALSRLARRGVLESSRVGRNTFYGLTRDASVLVQDAFRRVLAFGERRQTWDGQWTIAAFSVPEEQRDVRHAVRNRLRWLGFAPLYDGMWVTPRPAMEAAARDLADLNVTAATVLTTDVDHTVLGSRSPLDAWDLSAVQAGYDEFIEGHLDLLAAARRGDVDPVAALIARTSVLDEWRAFPANDPDLPVILLPARWPRGRAREVFAEIYNALAPAAVARVREVVTQSAPDRAASVGHHLAALETDR